MLTPNQVDASRKLAQEVNEMVMDLEEAEKVLNDFTGKPSAATVESAIKVANIEAARFIDWSDIDKMTDSQIDSSIGEICSHVGGDL
jgi:hypothetical protein